MIATMERSLTASEASRNLVVASLEGVNKNYGSIRALTAVDFQVQAGEVALCSCARTGAELGPWKLLD